MRNRVSTKWFLLSVSLYYLCLSIVPSAVAMDTGLVGILTKQLGVSNAQAEGGSGAIFEAAAQNMSDADFATVTGALPEINSLINAAPKLDSGTLGAVSSALGQSGGAISALAGLTDAFSKLGMRPDMVQQFLPIVLDYAQSKGGDTVANLLKAALQ
jgi:hypothetical protein